MDLPKAVNTINHKLFIAKLDVYEFSNEALVVLLSYVQESWKRVKIKTSLISWTHILQGVPQTLVLGPIPGRVA